MQANYVSVTEFRQAHPELDLSQYTDATVSGFISKASRYIENFCQVDSFAFQAVSQEVTKALINNNGDLRIITKVPNIASVSEIVLFRGTWNLTLTLQSGSTDIYTIPEPKTSILYPNTFIAAVGTFTMNDLRDLRAYDVLVRTSYTAGYQDIPQDIVDACILLTRDIVSRKFNAAGASSISQGSLSIRYAEREGKSDAVEDAERLLADYRRVVTL